MRKNPVEPFEQVIGELVVIDGEATLVGGAGVADHWQRNMDSRSFLLNDEISVALLQPALAARLEQDFERDLGQSCRVTLDQWKARPWWERVEESMGSLYQRQQ